MVVVCRDADSFRLLDRRRIVIAGSTMRGGKQPYHYAAELKPGEAEVYLAEYASTCEGTARRAVVEAVDGLSQYRIAGSAVVLASGRPLPELAKILASHPLIHTAEGEFFRSMASKVCESLKIPVTAVRERDLEQKAKSVFGNSASRVQRRIATLGSSIGPPWTKDHKTAALAAATILA